MSIKVRERTSRRAEESSLSRSSSAQPAVLKNSRLVRARQMPAMKPMDAAREGSIFASSDLALPITLHSRPIAKGWNRVESKSAFELERELRREGWHLFYLIPDVQAAGISRFPAGAVRKALVKIFAKALANRVNTLEIASFGIRRVLGMYHVNMVAKLRHIQESPYPFTTVEEMRERQSRVKYQVDPRLPQLLRRAGLA